jgi:hypothetical protein
MRGKKKRRVLRGEAVGETLQPREIAGFEDRDRVVGGCMSIGGL